LGERTHEKKITRRKAAHVGEFRAKIMGEALHYFASPAFVVLAVKDKAAYLPVKQYQFAVNAKNRFKSCVPYAPF
ncbi:MAG: hypothetical protein M0033_04560, partial [Nitrospiraceae bacterium]|nr:hypothetical protein [Nitrospiraceae bacterium]